MKPQPTTLETRRRDALARCAKVVANLENYHYPPYVAGCRAVVALGPDPSVEAILAAMRGAIPGSRIVAHSVRCYGCHSEVQRAVHVGDDPNDDSVGTATLCRECLVAALAALDGAP